MFGQSETAKYEGVKIREYSNHIHTPLSLSHFTLFNSLEKFKYYRIIILPLPLIILNIELSENKLNE